MKGRKGVFPSPDLPDDLEIAILGHELNNVLSGILGMAELLSESNLTAEQQRWLGAIEHSGWQMQSLIRTVQPTIVPYATRFDGVELLEHVMVSHAPAARSRKNRLLLIVHSKLARYWFLDACLVRQLLDNLVGNAIKFTCGGDVMIEVEPVAANGGDEEALLFRISDTGSGFDMAAIQHIFQAYTRCISSPEHASDGCGLGLYICRNIVRAMNGRISCSSPAHGGACFEITLPGALCGGKTPIPVFRSDLFTQIRCELDLANPMRRSVKGFLDRLGVRHIKPSRQLSDKVLVLNISEVPQQPSGSSSGLILTPRGGPGVISEARVLDAPVLESSLGRLLLELTLELRSPAIRNENPGSVPAQR